MAERIYGHCPLLPDGRCEGDPIPDITACGNESCPAPFTPVEEELPAEQSSVPDPYPPHESLMWPGYKIVGQI